MWNANQGGVALFFWYSTEPNNRTYPIFNLPLRSLMGLASKPTQKEIQTASSRKREILLAIFMESGENVHVGLWGSLE